MCSSTGSGFFQLYKSYGADGMGPSIYITDPEGNVVELKGPPGICNVRLEYIEQGSAWQPFFEHKLEREATNGHDDATREHKHLSELKRLVALELRALADTAAFFLRSPGVDGTRGPESGPPLTPRQFRSQTPTGGREE